MEQRGKEIRSNDNAMFVSHQTRRIGNHVGHVTTGDDLEKGVVTTQILPSGDIPPHHLSSSYLICQPPSNVSTVERVYLLSKVFAPTSRNGNLAEMLFEE